MESVYERPVGGATVRAVVGDLTTAPTDAIVNAANTHLRHGGGVAGAIVRAGGDVIQDESDAWVEAHGPLTVGSAAVTGAGSLPCRYVVHTAGPVYGQGDPDDETHLRRAVSGALAAAPPDVRTIAFPAISAGIYGYPPDEATAIIAAEVVGWLDAHPGRFDRVDLVGMDRLTADRFAAALRPA